MGDGLSGQREINAENEKNRIWKEESSAPCVRWIKMGIEKEQERNQRWKETNKKERNIYRCIDIETDRQTEKKRERQR